MAEMTAEVEAVRRAEFRLNFVIPTSQELAKLRRVHRDRSDAEVASLNKATRNAQELIGAIERDEIDLDDPPSTVRLRLTRLIREDVEDGAN